MSRRYLFRTISVISLLSMIFLSTSVSVSSDTPSPLQEPLPGSVLSEKPMCIMYTNDSPMFASFTNQEWRPQAIDENGQIQAYIHIYNESKVGPSAQQAGEGEYLGKLPSDSTDMPYERVTLLWMLRSVQDGKHKVEIIDRRNKAVLDQWSFEVKQGVTETQERFILYRGSERIAAFTTTYAASAYAKLLLKLPDTDFRIVSSKTGQAVENVTLTPTQENPAEIAGKEVTSMQPGNTSVYRITGQEARVVYAKSGAYKDKTLAQRTKVVATGDTLDQTQALFLVSGNKTNVSLSVPARDEVTAAPYVRYVFIQPNTTVLLAQSKLSTIVKDYLTTAGEDILLYPFFKSGNIQETRLHYRAPGYANSLLETDTVSPRLVLINGTIEVKEETIKEYSFPGFEKVIGRSYTSTLLSVVQPTGTRFVMTASEDGNTSTKVVEGSINMISLANAKSVSINEGETSSISATNASPTNPSKAVEGKVTMLGLQLPTWAWVAIGAVAGIIIILLFMIVILLIVRRRPAAS